MIEQPNGGGQAFPIASDTPHKTGLTKRDWFAGQALSGICASAYGLKDAWLINCAAVLAYQIADAMLEARK